MTELSEPLTGSASFSGSSSDKWVKHGWRPGLGDDLLRRLRLRFRLGLEFEGRHPLGPQRRLGAAIGRLDRDLLQEPAQATVQRRFIAAEPAQFRVAFVGQVPRGQSSLNLVKAVDDLAPFYSRQIRWAVPKFSPRHVVCP